MFVFVFVLLCLCARVCVTLDAAHRELSDNWLVSISNATFAGLSALNYLVIYGNDIAEIHGSPFSNSPFLGSLCVCAGARGLD